MTMKEDAMAFFEACETGKGWDTCKSYCTPTASFSGQADALASVRETGVLGCPTVITSLKVSPWTRHTGTLSPPQYFTAPTPNRWETQLRPAKRWQRITPMSWISQMAKSAT